MTGRNQLQQFEEDLLGDPRPNLHLLPKLGGLNKNRKYRLVVCYIDEFLRIMINDVLLMGEDKMQAGDVLPAVRESHGPHRSVVTSGCHLGPTVMSVSPGHARVT